jgi:hypothetical protein
MAKRIGSLCNETRKFSGLEGSRLCEFPLFERARVLKIGSKDVIYQQAYSSDGPYVLVPGYMTSEVMAGEKGKYCNVFPISDKEEKEKVEGLLAAKTIGEANFWN